MSHPDSPQLDVNLPSTNGSGTSFKRSFEEYGLDLDGAEERSADSNGRLGESDRNKRARSSSAEPPAGPSVLSASASSTSSSAPESGIVAATGADMPGVHPMRHASRATAPAAADSTPAPSTSTGRSARRESGLFPLIVEAEDEEMAGPSEEAPARTWAALETASSLPDLGNTLRASIERYEAFDSNISALRDVRDDRATASPAIRRARAQRSPSPPPVLPPFSSMSSTLLDSDLHAQQQPFPRTRPTRNPALRRASPPIESPVAEDSVVAVASGVGSGTEDEDSSSRLFRDRLRSVGDLPLPSRGSTGATDNSDGDHRRSFMHRLTTATEHIHSAIELLRSPSPHHPVSPDAFAAEDAPSRTSLPTRSRSRLSLPEPSIFDTRRSFSQSSSSHFLDGPVRDASGFPGESHFGHAPQPERPHPRPNEVFSAVADALDTTSESMRDNTRSVMDIVDRRRREADAVLARLEFLRNEFRTIPDAQAQASSDFTSSQSTLDRARATAVEAGLSSLSQRRPVRQASTSTQATRGDDDDAASARGIRTNEFRFSTIREQLEDRYDEYDSDPTRSSGRRFSPPALGMAPYNHPHYNSLGRALNGRTATDGRASAPAFAFGVRSGLRDEPSSTNRRAVPGVPPTSYPNPWTENDDWGWSTSTNTSDHLGDANHSNDRSRFFEFQTTSERTRRSTRPLATTDSTRRTGRTHLTREPRDRWAEHEPMTFSGRSLLARGEPVLVEEDESDSDMADRATAPARSTRPGDQICPVHGTHHRLDSDSYHLPEIGATNSSDLLQPPRRSSVQTSMSSSRHPGRSGTLPRPTLAQLLSTYDDDERIPSSTQAAALFAESPPPSGTAFSSAEHRRSDAVLPSFSNLPSESRHSVDTSWFTFAPAARTASASPPTPTFSTPPVLPPFGAGFASEFGSPWDQPPRAAAPNESSDARRAGLRRTDPRNMDVGSLSLAQLRRFGRTGRLTPSPPPPTRATPSQDMSLHDLISRSAFEGAPDDLLSNARRSTRPEAPALDLNAFHEGPFRATLQRYSDADRSMSRTSSHRQSDARESARPRTERMSFLPPLRFQVDGTSPVAETPTSAESPQSSAFHRDVPSLLRLDRRRPSSMIARSASAATASSSASRRGPPEPEIIRDHREMHSAVGRRLRMEASRLEGSDSSGRGDAPRTIDVLRTEGMSRERHQQLIDRFQRERERERERAEDATRPLSLWGDIDDVDGGSAGGVPGPMRYRRRRESLFAPRTDTETPSLASMLPRMDTGSGAARRTSTSRSPTRDTVTERDRAAQRADRHARLRAARMRVQSDREALFSDFTGAAFMNYFSRRAGRNVGDYVRDEDFDTSYEGLLSLAETLGDVRPRATPEHVIGGLPSGTFEEWATPEGDQRCPICLDDYQPEDACLRLADCSHWFHRSCLEQWLHSASTCPVCRKRVYSNRRPRPSLLRPPSQGPSRTGGNHDSVLTHNVSFRPPNSEMIALVEGSDEGPENDGEEGDRDVMPGDNSTDFGSSTPPWRFS